MISIFHNLLRLAFIFRTLARHGVVPFADRFFLSRAVVWVVGLNPFMWRHRRRTPRAVRLRMAMEELGPTFIKFGQTLSTRMETLPKDIGLEMKRLQDDVPPFPFETVKQTIEDDLNNTLETLFRQIEPVPVASASIAQVHRALTRDGRDVAVKVLRPNVEQIVEQDIRVLTALAELIEEHIPEWNRFKVRKVVVEFADTIRGEMNFQVEAARAQRFRKNFEGDPVLHVPQIHWPLTSRRVMTSEWVTGVPIDDLAQYPGPRPDVQRVARNVVTVFFKQVFRDGFFHADQHPGNLLVKPDGTLIIVDFGIVGTVSHQTRIWLAELLHGFISQDYRKVARIHLAAGYIPDDTDVDDFEEACRQMAEPIFGRPLKEISIANLLSELFKVTEQFQMEVQPQLLLLQKTMFTLEGVGRELDPEMNMWVLAEPLIADWMRDNLGPKGKLRTLRQDAEEVFHSAGNLPRMIYDGVERLARDRVKVRLHPASMERLERRMSIGFRRQATAIGGGAFLISSAILAAGGMPFWWWSAPCGLGLIYVLLATRSIR
ncbi:MAG: 2-polyprenylphenol 6-hydroxylase [Magnetococcales bacterium]|nr:2-polyprenylphenol 6-hydroxylase [Magnetococcales bacterium]